MNVASGCFQGQDWMLNTKFGCKVISEMEIWTCVIQSKSSQPATDEPFGPESDVNTFTFSSDRTVFCFLVIHSIVNVVHTPFNLVCFTISRWRISADCLIKTVTVIFSSSIWWTNAQNTSTHTQNNNCAGLWVGQMVPSTPSYQRSDENRLKKRLLPGNIISQRRQQWEGWRCCEGSETWKEEEERGGGCCKNIDSGLIISCDLSIQSVTPSTICVFFQLLLRSLDKLFLWPRGSDAVECVGVKNSQGVKTV